MVHHMQAVDLEQLLVWDKHSVRPDKAALNRYGTALSVAGSWQKQFRWQVTLQLT